MMRILLSELEFQLEARSVEGRCWSKRYSSIIDAISVAEKLGMQVQPNTQLLLEQGSRMPGYPQGCKDDACKVKDAELAKQGFEQAASWIPGPVNRIH
jgi:hypothetical protein